MADPVARTVTLLLNYKLADLTVQCLGRLMANPCPDHLVVLIDNGSGAEQTEILERSVADQQGVELLLLDTNLGYCAAMNRGVARAAELGAEYVLFLNNDVQVKAGCLKTLTGVLDNDPALAGVAPVVLRPDGRVWCEGAEAGFAPNLTRLLRQGQEPAPVTAAPRSVGFLPGACVLYRITDLQGVRSLDESYFMYFEDIALGTALRAAGRQLICLPWVRVTHAAGSSSGGPRSPLRKYLMAANSLRFLRQQFSLKLWVAFFLFDCLGLPLAYLTGGWRVGWAKTLGIVDGVRGRPIDASVVARWMTS